MVCAAHADDAADDGNAERIRGQRLRRVLMALRPQIGREIDAGFQPAVREYAVRRTVEAARVQTADHLHPALRLAAADDAARIRIRADGHIIGNRRQPACTVAVRGDGDGVRIGGGRHSARHIVPVLRDARQESVQRPVRPVRFRVGALIADQTAAERLCGDRAEAVVDPETADRDVRVRIDHVRADRAADIVTPLHAGRFDGQRLPEERRRGVQTDQTTGAVAGGENAAADQGIIDVDRAVCIVAADQTADVVPADHDARHAARGDDAFFVKDDPAAVVAGQAARIAAGRAPAGDAPIDRAVGVRNVARAVHDGRVFLVCAADAADIRLIACGDAGVDAVFDGGAAAVAADDAADIGVADDAAGVGGDAGRAVLQQQPVRALVRAADDAADVFASEHIAVRPGGAAVQHAAVAVADDAADIPAAQQAPVGLRILVVRRAACPAGAAAERGMIGVADDAADIASCERGLVRVRAAEDQTLVRAVEQILSCRLTAARKIACDAAGRAVARDRGAAREVFDGRAGHGQSARDAADAARLAGDRQRAGHSARDRQTGYSSVPRDAARDAADALCICRSQRRLHACVLAVHAVALERAAAVAADRADALERARGDVYLRREQAQTAYRAGILLKQAEILRVRVDRGIIQPKAADGVPAGEYGGDAVQQTARAVQRLTGFQLRDARKADVRAGGDRERAVRGRAVDPYAVAHPVERTRGNGKFRRRIRITDVGQMTEGLDLVFGAVGARAVSEERIGAVRVDDVALLVHLAAVVCRVRVGEGLHGRVDLRRCGEPAAEARDAGAAALAEGRLVLGRKLVEPAVKLRVHHAVQHQRSPPGGLVVFYREGIVFRRAVLVRDLERLCAGFEGAARDADGQQPFFVRAAVQLHLIIYVRPVLRSDAARPAQRERFAVDQIDRGDLELCRVQIDDVHRVLHRIIAQTLRAAEVVACAAVHVQPFAGQLRRLAERVRAVVQSLAVRAVKDRVDMTAFHVDLDADRGVQQTFVIGILRKQLVDETAVARELARGIFVRVQTDAVDAAAQLFLLSVGLVERPVEHALVLHPSAKRLPFAAGAAVRQRGFRGQIHGFCAGLVPAELRQVDIPEQVRDSDGEQNAQNDQRNGQLHQGKAAFSAPFRHARCLLSVPVQKQGNTAPTYPFYILSIPVFPVKHRRRSSTASRPFPPFFPFSAPQCAKKSRWSGLRQRLSKNFVFPTICVLTSQNTDVRKFPCGNFLPLKVSKPRYTPPVLIYLLRKYYFVRAAARLPFLHENKLYRQTAPKRTPAAFLHVSKNRLLYLIIYRAFLPDGGASSPG